MMLDHGRLDIGCLRRPPRPVPGSSIEILFSATLIALEQESIGDDPTGKVKSTSLIISEPIISGLSVLADGGRHYLHLGNQEVKLLFCPDSLDDFQETVYTPGSLFCARIGSFWNEETRKLMSGMLLMLRNSRGLLGNCLKKMPLKGRTL
jgi:hypothetical protein